MDNDKQLSSLFSEFNPSLVADSVFMTQLKRKMEAVEMIKQYAEARRRRTKLAICIAACVGFVAGVVFTLCFPYLSAALGRLVGEWAGAANFVADYGNVAIWCVIATATVFATYSAYDITLSATHKSCPMV